MVLLQAQQGSVAGRAHRLIPSELLNGQSIDFGCNAFSKEPYRFFIGLVRIGPVER